MIILMILSKTRYCVTRLIKIFASFLTEKRSIYKMSHFPWKNAVSAVHKIISLVADLMAKTPIHYFG